MEDNTSILVFFVNGKKVVEKEADPHWTLLYYLRRKLSLCGTKLGCAEGGCGACTVMLSKYDRAKKSPVHMSVNACLCPVVSVHGCAVTTVEGIGSTRTRPHPVQACLAEHHGSQCGFCTPGIVMSAYTMLRSLPRTADENDLQVALQGNLCRCTGYRPILEGLMGMMTSRSCDSQSPGDGCPMGEQCCKTGNVGRIAVDDAAADPSDYWRSLSQQEPIFPPEFVLTEAYDQQRLVFRGRRTTWYRPTSLPELLELKSEHSVDARIVVGNTEIGIEVKFKGCQYPVMIQPNKVPELNVIKKCVKGLIVGAAVTIDRLESELSQLINTMLDYKVQIIKALLDMIPRFASKQIRNVACIAGNIVTSSPASDLNPIFLAARCRLKVQSKKNGTRILKMDDTFFTGYRTNVLRPDEVIIDLFVPFTEKNAYFKSAKQSRRRDDDIALVNGAFYATVSSDGTVTDAELAFGGVSATAVVTQRARSLMVGGPWSEAMLDAVCVELLTELPLPANAPGGMSAYRRTLALRYAQYC